MYSIVTIQRQIYLDVLYRHRRWVKRMSHIRLPVLWLRDNTFILLNGHHRYLAAKLENVGVEYYELQKIKWKIHGKSLYTIMQELKNSVLITLDKVKAIDTRKNQIIKLKLSLKNCLANINNTVKKTDRFHLKRVGNYACKQIENIYMMLSDIE